VKRYQSSSTGNVGNVGGILKDAFISGDMAFCIEGKEAGRGGGLIRFTDEVSKGGGASPRRMASRSRGVVKRSFCCYGGGGVMWNEKGQITRENKSGRCKQSRGKKVSGRKA